MLNTRSQSFGVLWTSAHPFAPVLAREDGDSGGFRRRRHRASAGCARSVGEAFRLCLRRRPRSPRRGLRERLRSRQARDPRRGDPPGERPAHARAPRYRRKSGNLPAPTTVTPGFWFIHDCSMRERSRWAGPLGRAGVVTRADRVFRTGLIGTRHVGRPGNVPTPARLWPHATILSRQCRPLARDFFPPLMTRR